MPFVTDSQLSALRSVAYRGLDSVATIQRQAQVETAFGSEAQWSTVASGVPCWIRAMGLAANITDASYREVVVGSFRVHFAVGTDVTHGDKLTIEGETFEVVDINKENTIQIFRTAVAKRVE